MIAIDSNRQKSVWFGSYLLNRKQLVVLEGQSPDWRTVNSGVPQGSVLGSPLFPYVHNIFDVLTSLPLIYADDTTLFEIFDEPAVQAGGLNCDF